MAEDNVASVTCYHAHVYYDADSKAAAARLRSALEARFDAEFGRWHDAPVGPHPIGSYQVKFDPELFGEIVPWLAFNRSDLTVFVHPQSGNSVPDHTDHAIWLGKKYDLKLDVLS
jgi:DOPA 4,5-dioxygenase